MVVRLAVVLCMLVCNFGCTTRNSVKIKQNPGHIPGITFSGGNGESFHDAIVITGARNKSTGVAAEYKYIATKHGDRGTGWLLVGQTVIREKNKIVDVIEIQLDSSDRRIFYFDVSSFLGKRR